MVCLKLGPKFQTRRFDPKLEHVLGSIQKAQRHGGHVVNPHSYPAHLTKHHKGTTTTYANCFGMNPNYYGKDHRCVFPFIYRGIVSIHSFILSIFRCLFHGQGKLHYFLKEKFLDTFKLPRHNLI